MHRNSSFVIHRVIVRVRVFILEQIVREKSVTNCKNALKILARTSARSCANKITILLHYFLSLRYNSSFLFLFALLCFFFDVSTSSRRPGIPLTNKKEYTCDIWRLKTKSTFVFVFYDIEFCLLHTYTYLWDETTYETRSYLFCTNIVVVATSIIITADMVVSLT